MKKRLLTLILALAMVFTCSVTAFAADTTADPIVSNGIMPMSDVWSIALETGNSFTSEKKDNFQIISAVKRAYFTVSIQASAPCTFYFFLYDKNGNMLGASSVDFTRSTTANMIPSPSSLPAGAYYYGYKFDRSGVSYVLHFTATT